MTLAVELRLTPKSSAGISEDMGSIFLMLMESTFTHWENGLRVNASG